MSGVGSKTWGEWLFGSIGRLLFLDMFIMSRGYRPRMNQGPSQIWRRIYTCIRIHIFTTVVRFAMGIPWLKIWHILIGTSRIIIYFALNSYIKKQEHILILQKMHTYIYDILSWYFMPVDALNNLSKKREFKYCMISYLMLHIKLRLPWKRQRMYNCIQLTVIEW